MRPAAIRRGQRQSLLVALATCAGLACDPAVAQEDLLRPGEAYSTRFSGTTTTNGPDGKPITIIDPAGTVGSIIDIRNPGRPPRGEHWINEPQRKPVTAREVGQVFGVALETDGSGPPNVYLAASSTFGLHRNADNSGWMAGMWGEGGGPGTIYRLDRDTGYRPRVFANVTLNGRPNSGPGLGNIAYDKWNRQIFASDLETGMIHRFGVDGSDRGFYDHGTQGRPQFLDATAGRPASLEPIPFDPQSKPSITDCPSGKFDNSPECWNFSPSGRRVWGLAVWKHQQTGETRLYYSVWSGPAFGDQSWAARDEQDKRNSVWSVKLDPEGGFAGDVRREFTMPDFFRNPEAIGRAGYSSPVSDIAFPECGGSALMLVGERGGIRNLGLDVERPFAAPHESRAFRVGLTQPGSWKVLGRYDVGFYNRRLDGDPYMRANCAGGVAFGPGYSPDGRVDLSKPNQFSWISGDSLCSVDGPCNSAAEAAAAMPAPNTPQPVSDDQSFQPDDAEVHGLQGMPIGVFGEITPPPNANDQAAGPDQAYLIDIDINVDPAGNVIPDTLFRNDATKIGDVAIYQVCDGFPMPAFEFPPPIIGHWPVFSHSRLGSHNPQYSHYRHGTHNPKLSHQRERSHSRAMTHHRHLSRGPEHSRERSQAHPPERSHLRQISAHRQPASHNPRLSADIPVLSHNRRLSHPRERSHNPRVSHLPPLSHNQRISKQHPPARSHNPRVSTPHTPSLSHNPQASNPHDPRASHPPMRSHNPQASNPHDPRRSHPPMRSHNPQASNPHVPPRSHSQAASNPHPPTRSHNPKASNPHMPAGSHNVRISGGGVPKGPPQRVPRGPNAGPVIR